MGKYSFGIDCLGWEIIMVSIDKYDSNLLQLIFLEICTYFKFVQIIIGFSVQQLTVEYGHCVTALPVQLVCEPFQYEDAILPVQKFQL